VEHSFSTLRYLLQNLPFKWAGVTLVGVDCLGFASLIHHYFGDRPYNLRLAALRQIYLDYPSEADLPQDFPLKMAQQLLEPRELGQMEHLDLLILRVHTGEQVLGTLLVQDGEKYVAFMSVQGGSRIAKLRNLAHSAALVGVFDPANILRYRCPEYAATNR
jgi:hypothetical protein